MSTPPRTKSLRKALIRLERLDAALERDARRLVVSERIVFAERRDELVEARRTLFQLTQAYALTGRAMAGVAALLKRSELLIRKMDADRRAHEQSGKADTPFEAHGPLAAQSVRWRSTGPETDNYYMNPMDSK